MAFSLRKLDFCCNCTSPTIPVRQMQYIIAHSVEIQPNTFFNRVNIPKRLRLEVYKYPNDFRFFSYGKIYWYKHSAIEYFFK